MTLFSIDNVLCPLKLESTIFLKSFALCPKGYSIFYMPKIYEGESNGTPLQYSCLENPMDGGAWWATVHGVAKESDRTDRLHFHFLLGRKQVPCKKLA